MQIAPEITIGHAFEEFLTLTVELCDCRPPQQTFDRLWREDERRQAASDHASLPALNSPSRDGAAASPEFSGSHRGQEALHSLTRVSTSVTNVSMCANGRPDVQRDFPTPLPMIAAIPWITPVVLMEPDPGAGAEQRQAWTLVEIDHNPVRVSHCEISLPC